jgi:hypothetical protein
LVSLQLFLFHSMVDCKSVVRQQQTPRSDYSNKYMLISDWILRSPDSRIVAS